MSIVSREPVQVLVIFRDGQAKPVQFRRGRHSYPISSIDLTYSERKGIEKLYYFSVSDGTNSFRLSYSSESMRWFLETEEYMV